MEEATFSATAKMTDPNGVEWMLTLREGQVPGDSVVEKAESLARLTKYLFGHGWSRNGHDAARSLAAHPVNVEQLSAPEAATVVAAQDSTAGTSGTSQLNKVTVNSDGHVEFHVGKFKWPFKEARGPNTAASLFDEALGFSAGDFVPGAKIEGERLAGLVVDWEKPDRYYNVLRVRVA